MQTPDFLICAPLQAANMSNGILGLIHLAKTIEKLGRTATMCQVLGENDEIICSENLNTYIPANDRLKRVVDCVRLTAQKFGVKLCSDFARKKIDASYVVYPENVLGNPLGAKNVVRYFLNRDGILKNGARVSLGTRDFILAHSTVMQPDAQHVCYFTPMNPLFNRDNTVLPQHRTLDLTYVGKGELYGFKGKIEKTVAITRTWPATKEELAIMLRNCRFFYTADACTNINKEALACGAIPVFIHNGPWTDAEIDAFEPGAMPRVRPSETLDEDGLVQFEIARAQYLQGLQACEQRWEPSVQEMIEKVDRHFASPKVSSPDERVDVRPTAPHEAARPLGSSNGTASLGSRKDRKRWKSAQAHTA
jgi:hypothetical protein